MIGKFQPVFFLNTTLLPFLRKIKEQAFGQIIWKRASKIHSMISLILEHFDLNIIKVNNLILRCFPTAISSSEKDTEKQLIRPEI